MGFSLSGLGKAVGSAMNHITGVTSSSNQAFSQSKYLANLSYQQQKEFAQNAHQWEMQDFEKAGLNPALTTQSSSAGAVASGGDIGTSGYAGTSAGNPILDIIGAINTTNQTNANTRLQKSQGQAAEMAGMADLVQALKGIAELPFVSKKNQKEINLLINQATELGTRSEFNKQQTATEMARTDEAWSNAHTAHWNSMSAFWNSVKNEKEGSFYQKYGMSKDQAIQLLKLGKLSIGR